MLFPKNIATRDFYGTWQQFMGIPQGEQDIPRSLREFARQPADEAWVYRCMSVLSQAAQGVPLKVELFQDGKWVPSEGENDPDADELQLLLDDVNPAWHGPLLQSYMEAASFVHGGSYVRKVRGRFGGRPQELYWLSGAMVEPVMGNAIPTGYAYQPTDGAPVTYAARDIIPLRETVNLENPYKLLSPLESTRYEISVNRQASVWNSSILRNWGMPPMAWVAPVGANVGPAEIGLIRRALRAIRGPQNQGKVPVLPEGLEPKVLSLNAKDADWIASRKVSRMAICAVAGVPLPLAGDDDKNSVYAVVRDAERVMWRLTLINKMDARAATFNSWLTPEFDPSRKKLRIGYDYSGIEALQPAPAEYQAASQEWVKLGVPLNEYASRFGFKPVDGGNEPRVYLRTGDLPLTENGALVTPPPQLNAPPPLMETGPKPRPETYNTQNLPKSLYRLDAVKHFIATGDTSELASVVPLADIPELAEGLRRRESAEMIARRLTHD